MKREFHQNVKFIREKVAKLKQSYVAEQLGVQRSHYSRMESGQAHFNDEQIYRLAEILEVEPSVLFSPTWVINNSNTTNQIGPNILNHDVVINNHYDKEIEHLKEQHRLLQEKLDELLKAKK